MIFSLAVIAVFPKPFLGNKLLNKSLSDVESEILRNQLC